MVFADILTTKTPLFCGRFLYSRGDSFSCWTLKFGLAPVAERLPESLA